MGNIVPDLRMVYDLAEDLDAVGAMQTTSRQGKGLSLVPALVGSAEWWKLLGTADLPRMTVEGIVASSYWTGHGDYPMFDIGSGDGSVTSWERYGDETRYVPGLRVRVLYTEQVWQDDHLAGVFDGRPAKVVVRVELEASDRREIGSGKHR